MTSKFLLLALFSVLIAFSGCKDDDDAIKYPSPRIKKVTTYLENSLAFERTYRYDAEGRIVKESIADDYYIQYAYLPGKVIIKATIPDVEGFPADPEDFADTLLLNDEGLQIAQSPSSTIEYDAQGYLVKRIVLINNVPNLNTFKIEEGNTIQWINKTGEQFENVVINQSYEFLPNTTNTIGNENYGLAFYGKQDKNLRAKTIFISYSSSGTYESSETYEYEWDARNRVVKRSTVGEPGNYTLYTYYE